MPATWPGDQVLDGLDPLIGGEAEGESHAALAAGGEQVSGTGGIGAGQRPQAHVNLQVGYHAPSPRPV